MNELFAEVDGIILLLHEFLYLSEPQRVQNRESATLQVDSDPDYFSTETWCVESGRDRGRARWMLA